MDKEYRVPKPKTVGVIVSGLKTFYPDIYSTIAKVIPPSFKSYLFELRMSREDFDFFLEKFFGKGYIIEDVAQKFVKGWLDYHSSLEQGVAPPEAPSATVPEKLDELVAEFEIAQEKAKSDLEKEQVKKDFLKQLQEQAEINEESKIEPIKETGAEEPQPETKVATEKAGPIAEKPVIEKPAVPKEISLPVPSVKTDIVSPPPTTSIAIGYTTVAKPAGIGKVTNFLVETGVDSAPKHTSKATLARLAFSPTYGISTKQFKEAVGQSKVSPRSKRTLIRMNSLVREARKSTVYAQFLSRYAAQNRITIASTMQEFRTSVVVAQQMMPKEVSFNGGSHRSYSFQPGFLRSKGFIGRFGNRFLGGIFRRGTGRALTRGAIKLFGKAGGRAVGALGKTGFKGVLKAIGLTIPGLDVALIAAEVGSWIERKLSVLKEKAPELLGIFAGIGAFGLATGSALLAGIGAIGAIGAYGMGGAGTASAALSGITGALRTITTGVLLPSLAGPIIFALIGIPMIVALILLIINSGAYIVPPKTELLAAIESPYVGIKKEVTQILDKDKKTITIEEGKTPEVANEDLPIEATYKITVKAKKGTLINIQFENTCRVTRDGPPPICDAPIPTGDKKPDFISPTKPFIFNYTNEYSGVNFQDSFVADIFKVTADAPEQPSAVAATSAVIKIGNPPEECPADWPTDSGYLTQGAYTPSGYSHRTMEAIDIGTNLHPVFAGHSGVVSHVGKSSCIGNNIEIESVCEGRSFKSQYAHLEGVSVRIGQSVTMGETIGLSGNTGSKTCTTGAHLHYRFMYVPSGNPSFPNNPPYMMKPYIPANVPRGCTNPGSCGVSI